MNQQTKSVGIVAEYNPFHNGHKYQIDFLRQKGYSTIVVAMSGNFVQRGTPAWTDKYIRTKMALSEGADFVFELPVLYTQSSAEGFAHGGISLLNTLPLDDFCFGCECDNLATLQKVADFMYFETCQLSMFTQETDSNTFLENMPASVSGDFSQEHILLFQKELKKHLKKGEPYPMARQKALALIFPELLQDTPDFFSGSNNILALEYLKACRSLNSSLHPLPLKRKDAGYHSLYLENHSSPFTGQTLASATLIRASYAKEHSLKNLHTLIPEGAFQILQEHKNHVSLELDDFSTMIYYCLRQAIQNQELAKYGDFTEELAQRIQNLLSEYHTCQSFLDHCKTKNITYSRLSRCILHLLLQITKEELSLVKNPVPYLRLLGMRRSKSSWLRQVSSRPIITKTADAAKLFYDFYQETPSQYNFAQRCFSLDILAADLYRSVQQQKLKIILEDEFRHSPIIVP